ncbi:MAG: hypothetical protein AB1349_04980 [Elusimicrobiota bacterium]
MNYRAGMDVLQTIFGGRLLSAHIRPFSITQITQITNTDYTDLSGNKRAGTEDSSGEVLLIACPFVSIFATADTRRFSQITSVSICVYLWFLFLRTGAEVLTLRGKMFGSAPFAYKKLPGGHGSPKILRGKIFGACLPGLGILENG